MRPSGLASTISASAVKASTTARPEYWRRTSAASGWCIRHQQDEPGTAPTSSGFGRPFPFNSSRAPKTPEAFRRRFVEIAEFLDFRPLQLMVHVLPDLTARHDVSNLESSGVEMSSPRVIASLLALSAAALLIASCGEQPLPTVASPVASTTALQSSATEFIDMLVDPAGLLGTLDEEPAPAPAPIVYPPGSGPDPWPPGPPPRAQPGVPVPTDPTTSAKMHIVINPEPVTESGMPVPAPGCNNHPYTWYYDQVLVNDSGLAITFTQRENFFDGRYTST